jgi:hypothetical protein
MATRTLLITTTVLSLAASAALAAGLTEQLQATRMTVVGGIALGGVLEPAAGLEPATC